MTENHRPTEDATGRGVTDGPEGGSGVSPRKAPGASPSRPAAAARDTTAGPTAADDRLHPGDTAPGFTLPDAAGKQVSLADYRGRKVIVYFYPAASTPGCTKEACDFRDNLAELNRAGIDVVGISPDKPAKLAKFRDNEKLTFPLLSDPDREVLTTWAAYGEKMMYGKKITGVIRSTFLVDENGTIELAQYNVRATGHVAKLRRDLSV
jgi:peroxiredoxin Q/BCP